MYAHQAWSKMCPSDQADLPVSIILTLVIVIGFCSMGAVLWMDARGRDV